jgi:RHS repeat-associated protein
VAEARYTPYGSTRWSTGPWPTDRRFTGQREEAGVELYDYNARMYAPLLARFLSADSIVQAPADPQTLNRYAYTCNTPLKYVDPSGHCFLFAGLDTLACLGAWMMVAGGLGLAGVASYQLMPDQIKADAGRAINALVTDLTRGPEAIQNTAGAGPQIDASPALGYPLGPVQGAVTGGGYPLAGDTVALQGSATVSLKDPLQAKITDRPSRYRKGVREAVEAKA